MSDLAQGLGTLAGVLLRGYAGSREEEERRRAIEALAQQYGVQLPPPQDVGFLERIVRPNAGQTELNLQQALVQSVARQQMEIQLARQKQAAQLARESTLETQKQGGRETLRTMQDEAAMERDKYNRTTPPALTPEQLANYRASAAASHANAALAPSQIERNQALAEQARMEADFMRRIIGGGGGLGGALAGGAGIAVPGQPGYEYLPSLNAGPLSLTPRPTIEREEEKARRVTTAREGAKPLSGTTAQSMAFLDAARESMKDVLSAAQANPDMLGVENSATISGRKLLGVAPPDEITFYANVDLIVENLTRAVQGSRPSDADRVAFQRVVDVRGLRTPEAIAAQLQAAANFAEQVVNKQLKLTTTPRAALPAHDEAPTAADAALQRAVTDDDDEEEKWRRANELLDLLGR